MKKTIIRQGSIAWYCRKYFKPVSILVCTSTILAIMYGATLTLDKHEYEPTPMAKTLTQHSTYTRDAYYDGDNIFITPDGNEWAAYGFESKIDDEPVTLTFDDNATPDDIYDDIIVNVESKLIDLGEYTITHYCRENYPHICNNGDSSTTSTGVAPTLGRTIAVDPSVIPYGTKVVIDGHIYTAEDCGGAIKNNRIDICVDTHEEALQLGKFTTEVYIVG